MAKQSRYGNPANYNTTPDTRANGDASALEVDVNGSLLVTPGTGAVFGNSTADGAAFTQNSTAGNISMGVYQASPDTITTGDAAAIGIDVNRNSKVVEQYAPGFEDNTIGVAKVEQRYSYSAVAVADVQVKASAGFLHALTFSCNDAAPTAGSIIVYDNTAESGTQVFNHTFTTTPFMPFTLPINVVMATGIYIGFTTVADVNVTPSYR